MIGGTHHVTSPIWNRIDWLAGPKVRVVGRSFSELKVDKTVPLKLYLTLSWRMKTSTSVKYFKLLTHQR